MDSNDSLTERGFLKEDESSILQKGYFDLMQRVRGISKDNSKISGRGKWAGIEVQPEKRSSQIREHLRPSHRSGYGPRFRLR